MSNPNEVVASQALAPAQWDALLVALRKQREGARRWYERCDRRAAALTASHPDAAQARQVEREAYGRMSTLDDVALLIRSVTGQGV